MKQTSRLAALAVGALELYREGARASAAKAPARCLCTGVRQPQSRLIVQIGDARILFAYNQWANQRLLAAVRLLPPAQFAQNLGASFGSVQGTVAHILDGEWHWLQFWQQKPRTKRVTPEDFADAGALSNALRDLQAEQIAFINRLTDADLQAPRKIRDSQYALGLLIQHMVNHSTYHRGQTSTLLRQLGQTPPATDFRVFLDLPVERRA